MRSLAVLAALSTLSACHLYFPGGDDDGGCDDWGGADVPEPAFDGQRNPETGQCEYLSGPYPCDNRCGPCPADSADEGAIALPTWGYCESQCTGLDEATCLDADGCRGIYEFDIGGGEIFSECWSTDMTGPIQGGNCEGLDAYTCSQHDDCIAVHNSLCPALEAADPVPVCGPADFAYCANEGGDVTCFGEVFCDGLPPDCPDPNTVPAIADGCWTGECITVDQCEPAPACEDIAVEATCIGMPDCQPLYKGVDCVCDDMGNCDCADWIFEGCETGPTMPPAP